MSKQSYDYENLESTRLDSSCNYDENGGFQQKLFFENEVFNHDGKTEILWSREKYFSEDFFMNDEDSFSDLSRRSTSSCSWHNDDFDMKSSTKVTKSLEAVNDALYEKQTSPFISKEVFEECCNWSNKFPYLRLKGEQIIKPPTDLNALCKSDQKECLSTYYENPTSSLQLEGKKMPLHLSDKSCKKVNSTSIIENQPEPFFEEIFACDEDNKYEIMNSQSNNMHDEAIESKPFESETNDAISLKDLQEKVIERLCQHIWPKILEVLQKGNTAGKTDKMYDDFQLPPIVTAHVDQMRDTSIQRPRTEDTSLRMADFPKLSTFLSVSPKVLQDRKECKSGKSSLRSSRPNSEIHLTMKNHVNSPSQNRQFSQKITNLSKMLNTPRQVRLDPKISTRKDEKCDDKMSLYLPALEEDITDPIDLLKGLSSQIVSKTTSITHFPNKPECFLPPIDTNDNLSPDVKLTRNLFKFFGSDLKGSSRKEIKSKTSSSRPNTCASKRGLKPSDNISYKFLNDTFSSIKSSQSEIKKSGDISEKQVTLFPIVTSLIPSREKNSNFTKKSFANTPSGRQR